MTKCIGIISYFSDDPEMRYERKRRCLNLFEKLNTHFKLPIILIAQNWYSDDLEDLKQFKNQKIIIERKNKLGITGARIELRRYYLENTNYDSIILLDDDSDLVIGPGGVQRYLQEIDAHPGMYGVWLRGFPRLMAMSRDAYQRLSFDYIKDMEAERGEIWEDDAYWKVYTALYPDKMYQFSKYNMREISKFSEFDKFSTWQPTAEQQNQIVKRWPKIVADWVAYERSKNE